MLTVILTLLGLWLIFTGSYWWALLALCMAVSIRFTLIIGFFLGVILLMWAHA